MVRVAVPDAVAMRQITAVVLPPDERPAERQSRLVIGLAIANHHDALRGRGLLGKPQHVALVADAGRIEAELPIGEVHEALAVLDRDTPVAQLIPVRQSRTLQIRKPAPGAPPLHRIKVPKRARLNVDIVALLLEERQGHR